METPYRRMTWDFGDPVSKDQIEQAFSNLMWIKENSPTARLYRNSAYATTDMVIHSGKTWIKANKKAISARATVKFAKGTFQPNATPDVTTGINIDYDKKIFCTIKGPGKSLYPTANGFVIDVVLDNPDKNRRLKKGFYIHWTAVARA